LLFHYTNKSCISTGSGTIKCNEEEEEEEVSEEIKWGGRTLRGKCKAEEAKHTLSLTILTTAL